MLVHIENPNETIRKPTKLQSEFNKVMGSKINIY